MGMEAQALLENAKDSFNDPPSFKDFLFVEKGAFVAYFSVFLSAA